MITGKLSVAGWQVSGWGELARCTTTADVTGPRLQVHADGNVLCSTVSFGTVPVLQASSLGPWAAQNICLNTIALLGHAASLSVKIC